MRLTDAVYEQNSLVNSVSDDDAAEDGAVSSAVTSGAHIPMRRGHWQSCSTLQQ